MEGAVPAGRGELPDNVIEFVAGQVGVPADDIGFYDWDGRQVKRHRAEIRRVTGFRECSVAGRRNQSPSPTTASGRRRRLPGAPDGFHGGALTASALCASFWPELTDG